MTKTSAEGDCFGFTFAEASRLLDDPTAIIIHGWVTHPWSKEAFRHAWIEAAGLAYDWQMIHVRGVKPLPIAEYHKIWKPERMRRYRPQTVLRKTVTARHSGPW